MLLTVAPVYAGILGLMVVALGMRVALYRVLRRSNDDIRQVMRVHGNAVENIPMFVVLLGFCEVLEMSPWALHGLGATFVFARVAHAFGLSRSMGPSVPRFIGICASWTLIGVAATFCIVQGLS